MVVRLEVWIITQLTLYKSHSPPQLSPGSKANMRKCRVPQEVYVTTAEYKCAVANIPIDFYSPWSLVLSTAEPPLLYGGKSGGLALWMEHGCPHAGCVWLSSLSCPQRPKQLSYQSDCPLTAHLSDVLGTPSVTRFCHDYVWTCVYCVCLSGFQSVLLVCRFRVNFPCFVSSETQINPAVDEQKIHWQQFWW